MSRVVDRLIDRVDTCPWPTYAAAAALPHPAVPHAPARERTEGKPRDRSARSGSGRDRTGHRTVGRSLYTAEERKRRDASHWTLVQGVLAPLQFVIFLVSLYLVVRYLATGEGLAIATASVVAKTLVLYTIMVTGSLWERDVFGRYLFAPSFFWEDVVSILVLVLHTAYLVALVAGTVDARGQMAIALAAYAAYVINASQFVLKFRWARQEQGLLPGHAPGTERLA